MLTVRSLRILAAFLVLAIAFLSTTGRARAQSLDWEGRTGGFVTPFAWTAGSADGGAGRVAAAFHVLSAGDVVGTHFQLSATIGLGGRLEAGITRSAVTVEETEALSSLFDRGFTSLHAKLNLVRERAGGTPLPAVSIGGIYRWQHEHIGAAIVASDPTKNIDLYLVATRRIDIAAAFALVANAGVRGTRAVFFGMAGNAPSWEARAFASGGVLLSGRIFAGAEWTQQPDHLDGVPTATIPATATGFVRLTPGTRFNLDVALVRLADVIAPGVDLAVGRAVAVGVGFRF